MKIEIYDTTKCTDCEHCDSEGIDTEDETFFIWSCSPPDGKYTIEVKNGELAKCPLGKW